MNRKEYFSVLNMKIVCVELKIKHFFCRIHISQYDIFRPFCFLFKSHGAGGKIIPKNMPLLFCTFVPNTSRVLPLLSDTRQDRYQCLLTSLRIPKRLRHFKTRYESQDSNLRLLPLGGIHVLDPRKYIYTIT